ncbi:MAG: branched-chain amino acid transport system II carrier protein [Arsenophonus sp. NC-QC1-MAG3]
MDHSVLCSFLSIKISNLGLTKLIKFLTPILIAICPEYIVLIIISFTLK